MSRSRRRTPIVGITKADSDKRDKALANRRHRRAVHMALADDIEAPDRREVTNAATFSKDGKQWIGDRHPELMRK